MNVRNDSGIRSLVVLVTVAAAMTAVTWQRWVNPIVDLGRELYVPWRLHDGAVLYRDIAYFNGPLSPYLNASIFSLFGETLDSLLIANGVFLALITLLLFDIAARLGDRRSGLVTGAFFLAAVAFANLAPEGNYSYLLPYSHEITHGFLLLLIGFALALRVTQSGSPTLSLLLGLSVGLAALTKVEIAASLIIGVTVQLMLAKRLWNARVPAIPLLCGLLAPPAIAIALLQTQMPLPEAAAAMTRGIAPPQISAVSDLYFYRRMAGFENVSGHLGRIAASLLAPLSLAVAWAVSARFRPADDHRSHVVLATVAAILTLFLSAMDFAGMVALLPLVVIVSAAHSLATIRRREIERDQLERATAALSFAAIAFVLMWKKLLNTQLLNYGFVIAIPALVLYFCMLLQSIPDALERRGKNGRLFRAGALGLIGAMAGLMLVATSMKRVGYTHDYESDRAHFRVPEAKHEFLEELTRELEAVLQTRETLAVLPEGSLFNFVLDAPNPTRFIVYMPIEVTMFGDDAILQDYTQAPPDVVVWLNRDMVSYGYERFGTDYGMSLAGLISENYQLHEEVGHYENDSGAWGAKIFVRPPQR